MITREELIEKAVRDSWEEHGTGTPWVSVPVHLREVYIKRTRIVIRIALEAAAEACEQQARDFSSEEYSANQPISTITERFACAQCADAIRSLIPENDND